ncbi:PA14 domain-containing protein [Pontibacter toksunensis]|uniref:PA14 domain-containing protein n=2 Tax=Pontibacter toksunensis TaxID=1332631 RepID=A0ABW6C2U2_9BACT
MPLGNSITQGTSTYPSYRYALYERLTEAYIDFSYVGSRTSDASPNLITPLESCPKEPTEFPPLAHEGHSGWRADQIINGNSNYPSEGKLADWLQGYTPDVVLMHLGSNDMFHYHTVSSTVTELREVVRILRQDNPNVTILLAQIFPADPAKVGVMAADNVKLLNKEIASLAQELNTTTSPILLVDQHTGFDPTPGADSYDGIHPNLQAEYQMSERWFKALGSVLKRYTTPPSVSITTPGDGALLKVNQAISIAADASDREETIKGVEFFANCQKIGEDFTSPYQIGWTPSEAGNYSLTAVATDAAGARGESFEVLVKVDNTTETGTITREYWANVQGTSVSEIPFHTTPTSTTELSSFEAPTNVAHNYGQRVRGYVQAPASGEYTFWIAADDNAELWLSTSENPADKVKLAFVEAWTNPREWGKYPGQKSAAIRLEAGKKYYIEAMHKQSWGGDNLAVGWQLPDGTLERPIPGSRLIPFTASTNQPPVASAGSDVSVTLPTSTVTLSGTGTDRDGTISAYSWSQVKGPGTVVFSSKTTASTTVTGLVEGTYIFQLTVTDNGGLKGSDEVSVTVHPATTTACTASGTILREHWANVSGSSVMDIPLGSAPSSSSQLSLFEAPSGLGSNYGAKVRGYICVPQTGNYTFFIASDDNSELWLSTTDSPANKQKIASVTGWTNSREWGKYASQKSAAIRLEAGKKYYVEALHKQGWGGDNLAVAWAMPDGKTEAPIPGSRLSPFVTGQITTCTASGTILREHWSSVSGSSVSDIPLSSAPSSSSQLSLFESPSGLGSNYGARVSGYICPPQTGNYTFYIASDDNSELWLSTTDSPANKQKIASVTGWTNSREWGKYASQKSAAIRLEAGKKYYVEALHKQGWGGDNLAVAWQLPDGKTEAPIPGSRLSPVVLSQTTTSYLVSGNNVTAESPLVYYYPNPFQQQVTLQFNGKKEEVYSLKLYDVTGREVWQMEQVEGNRKLTIGQSLDTGVYVLVVSTGKEAKQYKLVKAR